MKAMVYRIYAFVFRIFTHLFPVRYDKVFLFMVHDCGFRGNIRYVAEETGRSYPGKKCVVYNKAEMLKPGGSVWLIRFLRRFGGYLRFLFGVNYQLATSGTIFLNDNFLPMAYMDFRKDVRVVQLWHGAGAFKRFGLSTETDPLVRRLVRQGNARLYLEPVSSETCVPIYSEAMGIPAERILPIGLPFLDFYFDEAGKNKALREFYKAYPSLRGKRLAFYCPTLRANAALNDRLTGALDRERLLRELGEDWVLLIRFHPKGIPTDPGITSDRVMDVTSYRDIRGIFVAADLMITDYSSAAVEYALLDKPLYVYGYDFRETGEAAYDRGTYLDMDRLPSGVSVTMEELISAVSDPGLGRKNAEWYVSESFQPLPDGRATERLLKLVYERD